MPLTLTEKLDSRKWTTGDNATVEMVYILTGTSATDRSQYLARMNGACSTDRAIA